MIARHGVQQQADQSVFKHHVQDVVGQEYESQVSENRGPSQHNQNHSPDQRQERGENGNLVATLLGVGNPIGPVHIGSNTCKAEQATDHSSRPKLTFSTPEQHREHQPEGIQIQQYLSNPQSLRNVRVIPSALRHG